MDNLLLNIAVVVSFAVKIRQSYIFFDLIQKMSNQKKSGFSLARPMSCTYASVFPSYIHQQGNLTWFLVFRMF